MGRERGTEREKNAKMALRRFHESFARVVNSSKAILSPIQICGSVCSFSIFSATCGRVTCSTILSLISICVSVSQFAATVEHSEKCTILSQFAFQSSNLRRSKWGSNGNCQSYSFEPQFVFQFANGGSSQLTGRYTRTHLYPIAI